MVEYRSECGIWCKENTKTRELAESSYQCIRLYAV